MRGRTSSNDISRYKAVSTLPSIPTPDIAFIGAGSIGAPMAERLLERGRKLLICDPAPGVRAHFEGLGCAVTDTAADCASCPIIIFMVANDEQLRMAAATLAPALDRPAGPLVLVMSTVLPETVHSVAEQLAPSGARVIDAPVSGGSIKARDGELSIMVGGDENLFNEARPLLDDLASSIFHCGALGSGETMKILNNLVGVTNLFLFSEAMRIADALNLDLPRLVDVMEQSSGRNAGTRDWEARKKLFAWNSTDLAASKAVVDVTRKDLRHAIALAQASRTAAPMLEAITAAHDATPYEAILDRWRTLASDAEQTHGRDEVTEE
ncbi:NAD(P)-dependent oxidoreductase [Pseudaminobacter salicylatoxidans]|uniref:NAD(P)-dependent oxidoreductase n=1 Tax=Pseudaminobacter salicylatoxidans TaxID=93369 RepID=UPI00244D9F13|nr:NAD(P)-dependent oxidoreductase [Pseudaminobacter salicylatoxidans]